MIVRDPMSAASPWLAHRVRLCAISPEIAGVVTYHLEFVDPAQQAGYACRPGQFNMLYVPLVGEIAISVSGRELEANSWAHTVRVAGNTTRALSRLSVGDQLGLRGPYGTPWPLEHCAGADLVLVAGGIGLAPLRAAVQEILAQRSRFGRVTLIYGARAPETLLYSSEYASWVAGDINVQTTVDRATSAWRGGIGVVPLLLDRLRPLDPNNTLLFACGPEVMMRYTVRSAFGRGMSSSRIFLSLERNMQCAVGQCGHCQLGPAFICKDGPVFRHDRIAPFLGVDNL
jgi:NAD(P)H-flavin reductase